VNAAGGEHARCQLAGPGEEGPPDRRPVGQAEDDKAVAVLGPAAGGPDGRGQDLQDQLGDPGRVPDPGQLGPPAVDAQVADLSGQVEQVGPGASADGGVGLVEAQAAMVAGGQAEARAVAVDHEDGGPDRHEGYVPVPEPIGVGWIALRRIVSNLGEPCSQVVACHRPADAVVGNVVADPSVPHALCGVGRSGWLQGSGLPPPP